MKKNALFLFSLFLIVIHPLWGQGGRWLRYPSISPDGKTIVFTYKGDLWKVATAGGAATPLTLHEAHDFMPVWSKDSKTIAFASDRFGNFDVYTIAAEGGEAKRLTFHSVNEFPYEFSVDNQSVVFGSSRQDVAANRQFPTGYMPELYSVPAMGGRVKQLFSTPAEDVKYNRDGSKMVYHDRKGQENAWRKHHTSSVARDIWMFDTKTQKHTKLTTFAGEDRNPIFAENDKSLFYLSETSGSFNVHQLSVDNPARSQAVTNFKKHPVRFLSMANNGTLCYGFDGEIYTQKANGQPQKVNIIISTDARANNERVVPVSGGVRDMAVSPNGKEVAYIFRGEVFVSSVEGGLTKRITNTPEQERSVGFSPDGKALIYSSERGNSWKIYETRINRQEEPYFYASTVLKETALIANQKENYQPSYSPDGKEVAFLEDRATLKILNLATKQTRTILTDQELFSWGDNDQYFQWSPDGKWFLFDYNIPNVREGEIGLISTDGKGKVQNITQSGFDDGRAKWVQGGKAMLWFSNREGLKSLSQSGNSQQDAYALFFTQAAFDKFKLTKEEAVLAKELDEKNAKTATTAGDTTKKKEAKKDTAVVIEMDGLELRKARLTIHSSNLSDALISKDGDAIYYLTRFEKGYNLWTTNLRTKETKQLVALNANGGGSMVWDKDQKSIFLNADGKISKIDPTSGKQESISTNGDMNLDVAAERAFMFEHVWRRTKKTFYTATFHGIDWDSYKPDYQAYLPHIGNNYEFSEMMSELLGELNVSHSGASYFGGSLGGDATAALGVFYDVNFAGPGVRVEEIIKDGPLNKANLNIKTGTIIEAIDGETLRSDRDLAQYLNRKSGKNVLLALLDGTTRREVVVKPISTGEESQLLYKRWVRRNQDEVEKLSGGALGYIHIPGMADGPFRVTYEEVMGKYATKKGIVVDTRNNGGGDLVSDLATFFSGKTYMYNATDKRVIYSEPSYRWTKPSISIANEANYSDGHCYAHMTQAVSLNKLVGQPVPGTCTFAGWESLQDPSLRWGVPPVGVKTMAGTYLENAQTEPNIKVWNDYEAVIKGKDQQLEKAVAELMKEVAP
ncbi:MAG: peptidase S41 [Runella slithyformis]|nr:MAG: peptidase S41 [Runella slithyformis]TAF48533.1 MAG: peptidase S41 [Runella slithyformis]TAF83331.1 MAG: peptidase S41 [Runella slithyformis]